MTSFSFQEERLAGAVGCLVPLETAIQETIEYCRDRKAFGQSVLDNQFIHYRFCDVSLQAAEFPDQNPPNLPPFQIG